MGVMGVMDVGALRYAGTTGWQYDGIPRAPSVDPALDPASPLVPAGALRARGVVALLPASCPVLLFLRLGRTLFCLRVA